VRIHGSGRTDAGVHARGLVAHFDAPRALPLSAFREGLNRFLPAQVAVLDAREVAADFHARFAARGKWYRYSIQTGPVRRPLLARSSWHLRPLLDLERINAAAAACVGRHDFAAFRTASCDARTTVRELYACTARREGEQVLLDVKGDGFLRNMVRIITGTLVEVGLGRRPAADLPRLLAGDPLLKPGPTAPAHGLCLMQVYYDPPLFTASQD